MKNLTLNPAIVVEQLQLDSGTLFVVRDDLLDGGTKQRAAIPFLRESLDEGHQEFVYASPFSGFAQIALASSCATLGVPCTLFCERDQDHADQRIAHEFTQIASSYGATVFLFSSLEEAEQAATAYSNQNRNRLKIPLGFDVDGFRKHLAIELSSQWEVLCQKVRGIPKNLWIPVGSGTLAKVFRHLVPSDVTLRCVDVHVLSNLDPRLTHVRRLSRLNYYSAPEKFSERVTLNPPIASNSFYDAKLWRFLITHAAPGDVWWNVAR